MHQSRRDIYWRESELDGNDEGSAYHRLGDGAIRLNISMHDPCMNLFAAHEALHSIQTIATTWGFAKLQLAAMELTYLKGIFSDSSAIVQHANRSKSIPSYAALHDAVRTNERLVTGLEKAHCAYALSRFLDGETLDGEWLRSAQRGWFLLADPAHWETSGLLEVPSSSRGLLDRANVWAHTTALQTQSIFSSVQLLEGAAYISELLYLEHFISTGFLTYEQANYCKRGLQRMGQMDTYSRAYNAWRASRAENNEATDMTFLVVVDLALNPNVCASLHIDNYRPSTVADLLPGKRFERLCDVTRDMPPIPLPDISSALEWTRRACARSGWDWFYDLAYSAWQLRNLRRSQEPKHRMALNRASFHKSDQPGIDDEDEDEDMRILSRLWEDSFEPVPYSFGYSRFVSFLETFAIRGTHPFALQFGLIETTAEAMAHNDIKLDLLHPSLVVFDEGYRFFSRDALKQIGHRMTLDALRHVLYVDDEPPDVSILREPMDDDLCTISLAQTLINRIAGITIYDR